jgi:hypothetical protein
MTGISMFIIIIIIIVIYSTLLDYYYYYFPFCVGLGVPGALAAPPGSQAGLLENKLEFV